MCFFLHSVWLFNVSQQHKQISLAMTGWRKAKRKKSGMVKNEQTVWNMTDMTFGLVQIANKSRQANDWFTFNDWRRNWVLRFKKVAIVIIVLQKNLEFFSFTEIELAKMFATQMIHYAKSSMNEHRFWPNDDKTTFSINQQISI